MSYQPESEQSATTAASSEAKRGKAGLVGLALLAVVVGVFIFQNTDSTNVNFLVFDWDAPLWIVLLITVAVGVLIGEVGPRLLRRARNKKST